MIGPAGFMQAPKEKKPACIESASGRHERQRFIGGIRGRYCEWCSHDMGPIIPRKRRRMDSGAKP